MIKANLDICYDVCKSKGKHRCIHKSILADYDYETKSYMFNTIIDETCPYFLEHLVIHE